MLFFKGNVSEREREGARECEPHVTAVSVCSTGVAEQHHVLPALPCRAHPNKVAVP